MNNRPMVWYLYKLWRFAPRLCMIHATLWGLVNLSELAPGLLISRLIDDLEAGNEDRIWWLVAGFAGPGLGQAVLTIMAGRPELEMRFRMSGVVRRNLLRMLLATPGSVALKRSVGDTISRFRDDAYLAEDAMDWTNEIVARVAISISAIGVMLWIDVRMALFSLLPTLAIIFGARLAGSYLAKLREASSEATSSFTSTVGDVIGAALPIQAAGAADRTVTHISGLAHARRTAMVRDRVVTQGVEGATKNASAIGVGLVMLLAATLIRNGDISVADFVLFTAWLGIVGSTANELSNYLAQMSAAKVAFTRMEAVTADAPAGMSIVDHSPLYLRGEMPEKLQNPPSNSDAAAMYTIDVAGKRVPLVPGEITVVTGRIGTGKSRLLASLLELDPAGTAQLHTDGDARIGYVPQIPRLFSGTVRENIMLGRDLDEADLQAVIKLAALERDIAMFAKGFETMVGSRGTQVSGGQAQRIALARALVAQPNLLVVDDLSSALDVHTERQVWQNLSSIAGLTVLAVSHRRFVIEQARQVIVLGHGEIEAVGSLTDLLQQSAEMRDLWAKPEE